MAGINQIGINTQEDMLKRNYKPNSALRTMQFKTPKKKKHKEHNHQKAIFELAKGYERKFPELQLMTGSMVGMNLTPQQARWAKDAGTKPGFPDIRLPVARGQWFNLYIELKTMEGQASPKQKKVKALLEAEGSLVLFIRGHEDAWNAIIKYLSMPRIQLRKVENDKGSSEKT